MANFQNNSITEYGRLLLAEVQAGAVFIPTRIVLGSGNLPAGKEPTTMTDVVSPVKDLNINKKEKTPDGKVVFGGAYDNQGVTKPFYLRELALYARAEYRNEDGSVKKAVDEVLYSYGNAGATADYMPAYSTETVVEKQLDLVVYVGNSAKVELTIASGTAMTVEMGEQMVDGLRKEVGQALEGKAEKTHKHTRKDITDFPTSLPASDVYEWAKQPSKPTYTANEVGAAASSHSHPVGDITGVLPVSKGGTGQTSLSALMSAMGAGKIVAGTYAGTGKYGSINKNSLNVGFVPKLLIVKSDRGECNNKNESVEDATAIIAPTVNAGISLFVPSSSGVSGTETLLVNVNGNTIYWYSVDYYTYQLNCSGTSYAYIAFG